MTDHTNLNKPAHTPNGNMLKHPGMQKLNDEYNGLYQSQHIQDPQLQWQLIRPVAAQFPSIFMQRPNTETETPKHKTLNNALVPKNKVLSTTWKLSVNHAPSHT